MSVLSALIIAFVLVLMIIDINRDRDIIVFPIKKQIYIVLHNWI